LKGEIFTITRTKSGSEGKLWRRPDLTSILRKYEKASEAEESPSPGPKIGHMTNHEIRNDFLQHQTDRDLKERKEITLMSSGFTNHLI
jgi:hypothetical protein